MTATANGSVFEKRSDNGVLSFGHFSTQVHDESVSSIRV
jgi:hypothetical protein